MIIYPCGIEIITKIGRVKAIITAASIRFEKIQYEVSYFLNGERKEVWLDEREFEVQTDAVQIHIGFKNGLPNGK